MIERIARVTRVEPGRVWVRAANSSACGGCAQKDGCGTAALGQALPERELAIDCPLPLSVGDQVKVAIADDKLLLATLIVYGLPLFAMLLVSMLLNQLIGISEYLPEAALATLLGVFWLIHRLQGKGWLKPKAQPSILGRF
jgi:sigma-E factor negative regulatory protein RseC